MGIIIGTSFVYDVYFMKVPNWILIPGYFILIPYSYFTGGIEGVWLMFISGICSFFIIFLIYCVGAVGGGDAKLMILICSYLSILNLLKFIGFVILMGGFMGLFKIAYRVLIKKERYSGKTGIRFTIPIVLGYLVYVGTVGGIN